MEPFSAVVTTGIYCRPGCSARPKAENVRQFRLAAAAEAAGYRACLRCRPDRSPQLAFWTGPELVCRAVQRSTGGPKRTSAAASGSPPGTSAASSARSSG